MGRVSAPGRGTAWPSAAIADDADDSMAEHVCDLQSLIRRLALAPAHVVGHSHGAFIALSLAIRRPALVRSLVLAEPPVVTLFVGNRPQPIELLRLLVARPRTAAAIVNFGARGIAPAAAAARRGDMESTVRTFGTAVLGRDAFRRPSPARFEQALANTFRAEFPGSVFPPLDPDQVRSIRAPALLLNGERSPRLFHRLNDGLLELLPNVRRVEIADACHIMHEESPSAYNDAVLAFLQSQSG